MTDMLYEKQGSYLQGGEDKAREIANILVNAGKLTHEEAVSLLHVSKSDILSNKK
jgi:polyhydroxyalkanoate synthesis regulator phasin